MIVAKQAASHCDEYYTPKYAVKPILKYIKPNSTIWCPFDTDSSEYVKVLGNDGHNVIATHIAGGADFFEVTPPRCDYIISNPPYSRKIDVLSRLFDLGIPFAMLVGIVGLFDSVPKADFFKDKEFEILYLNPRVGFTRWDGKSGVPPYQSGYMCHHMLPKQIMFERVYKK